MGGLNTTATAVAVVGSSPIDYYPVSNYQYEPDPTSGVSGNFEYNLKKMRSVTLIKIPVFSTPEA